MTAVVSPEAPSGPTGSVTFKNGITVLNTVQLSSGIEHNGDLGLGHQWQRDASEAAAISLELSQRCRLFPREA
jgi:hypothetical protein